MDPSLSQASNNLIQSKVDPSSFSSLPTEILHIILSHLHRPSLVKCSRLNKRLYILSAPYLWRILKVTRRQHSHLLADVGYQALVKNARHVRTLGIFATPDNLFLPKPIAEKNGEFSPAVCTDLRTISFHADAVTATIQNDQATATPELAYAMASLVQQNRSLTNFYSNLAIGSEALLQFITPESSLRELFVHFGISAWTAKHLLCRLPECIRAVRLHCVSNDRHDETDPSGSHELMVRSQKNHHALMDLDLRWVSGANSEEYVLLPFLETCCPNMLRVVVDAPRYFVYKRLGVALKRLGIDMPTLDPTNFPARMKSSDKNTAKTIRLNIRWQTMVLWSFANAGPLAVAAILKRCEHVRILNAMHCPWFPSRDLCTLLGRAKALERLVALSANIDLENINPVILATDLLEVIWASQALVGWACMIRVARPTRRNHETEDSQTNDLVESHIIQRQVYRKLAMQTGLQMLHLGHIDDTKNDTFKAHESWHQDQCLEMTLASGLDELSGLKELTRLDVSFMDHGIGVPELEWMADNWPKLKRIVGLFQTCRSPVPGARQWILRNRPEWVTVRNRSSFRRNIRVI